MKPSVGRFRTKRKSTSLYIIKQLTSLPKEAVMATKLDDQYMEDKAMFHLHCGGHMLLNTSHWEMQKRNVLRSCLQASPGGTWHPL